MKTPSLWHLVRAATRNPHTQGDNKATSRHRQLPRLHALLRGPQAAGRSPRGPPQLLCCAGESRAVKGRPVQRRGPETACRAAGRPAPGWTHATDRGLRRAPRRDRETWPGEPSKAQAFSEDVGSSKASGAKNSQHWSPVLTADTSAWAGGSPPSRHGDWPRADSGP